MNIFYSLPILRISLLITDKLPPSSILYFYLLIADYSLSLIHILEERKAEKIDMEAAGEAPANKGKKKSAKARLDKSDEEANNAAKAAAFLKEDEEA